VQHLQFGQWKQYVRDDNRASQYIPMHSARTLSHDVITETEVGAVSPLPPPQLRDALVLQTVTF